MLNIKLLSTLQNKFALSKSWQEMSIDFDFVISITNVQIISVVDWQKSSQESLSQSKRKLLIDLNLVLQLAKIQIMILKKNVRNMFETTVTEEQKTERQWCGL